MRKSTLLSEAASIDADYGLSIRANIRMLWTGEVQLEDFYGLMLSTIDRGLTRAWFQGAAKCGILPDELTTVEIEALRKLIAKEKSYVFGFAMAIEAGSKANGGKLGVQLSRSKMWVNRALEAFNRGQAMACADAKAVWILGKAEHCNDCPRLNGKVKRFSWWIENNLIPQTPGQSTECGGWRCRCRLEKTALPISRGRMPATSYKRKR